MAPQAQRYRLALAMLGSGLFLTILATAGAHYLFRPILRSGVERELTTAAQQLADRLDQGMFERWQDIKLAAGRQALRDRAGDDAEREVVEEIKARHPRYAWVGFTDANCIVRVSTEKTLAGMNVETRPWCNEARKGPFVGDIHEAVLLKSRLKDIGKLGLLMDIAIPVRSPTNEVTGVLAAHLMADWLLDATVPKNGGGPIETAIITSQGQVILPTGLTSKARDASALAAGTRGPRETQWSDGNYLSALVRTEGIGDFPGFGWTAVARLPAAQAEPLSQTRLLFWIVLGGSVASLLLFAAGLLLARSQVAAQSPHGPVAMSRPQGGGQRKTSKTEA